MTTPDDSAPPESTPATGSVRAENTKPITIMVPEDTLRKLKIVAIMRETSVSELLAEAASAVVKRELKKAISKLEM